MFEIIERIYLLGMINGNLRNSLDLCLSKEYFFLRKNKKNEDVKMQKCSI